MARQKLFILGTVAVAIILLLAVFLLAKNGKQSEPAPGNNQSVEVPLEKRETSAKVDEFIRQAKGESYFQKISGEEKRLVEIALEAEAVQKIYNQQKDSLTYQIEDSGNSSVSRVAFQDRKTGVFLAGVDVSKDTWTVVDSGLLD